MIYYGRLIKLVRMERHPGLSPATEAAGKFVCFVDKKRARTRFVTGARLMEHFADCWEKK